MPGHTPPPGRELPKRYPSWDALARQAQAGDLGTLSKGFTV